MRVHIVGSDDGKNIIYGVFLTRRYADKYMAVTSCSCKVRTFAVLEEV